MYETDRAKVGLEKRRGVLGDAHVERALTGLKEFNAEFQDLITRYAWGEIWTSPGLDERARRLLVLSTMIALGRSDEFKMHVRAAIEHGISTDDIKEVLLQSAIHCGVPAANEAFDHAEEGCGSIGKVREPSR